MNIESMLDAFLNNPYVINCVSNFKTSNWKTLDYDDRLDVYNNLFDLFCSTMQINSYSISYKENCVGQFEIYNMKTGQNVFLKEHNNLVINDIAYNQYCTLYECFIIAIHSLQRKVCFSKGNKTYNDYKEKWEKDLSNYVFGEYIIEPYGTEFVSYSGAKLDAKKYAEKLVFAIANMNFDYKECYDEETFVSDTNLLVDKSIIKIGSDIAKEDFKKNKEKQSSLEGIVNRISELRNLDDMDLILDENLFLFVYPGISENVDVFLRVKAYNEIVKRIYNDSIKLELDDKHIYINNKKYASNYFKYNSFNIILDEIFRKMESDLCNDRDFLASNEVHKKGLKKAIIDYKKQWLSDTLGRIDACLYFIDFSIIKYKPLSRLLEDKNLDTYLLNNTLKKSKRR